MDSGGNVNTLVGWRIEHLVHRMLAEELTMIADEYEDRVSWDISSLQLRKQVLQDTVDVAQTVQVGLMALVRRLDARWTRPRSCA